MIADLMYRADSTDDFELDVRRWAIAAATTKTILAATVWELIDAGWLVRTRPHSGPKAAAYRLVIPAVQKVGHKVTHPCHSLRNTLSSGPGHTSITWVGTSGNITSSDL
ncbi:hypothetical protein GCM10020255_022280 [Rhodococcus baikonurensis]